MPITIKITKESCKLLNEAEPLNLNFIPAKIHGDGEAKVDKYFSNYTNKDDLGILTNSLRGRPLCGKESVGLPAGYMGLVLQEEETRLSKDAERHWKIFGHFKHFNYWNYDKVPSEGDHYNQAIQITRISEALSTTITEADVLEEIARHRNCNASVKEKKIVQKVN